MDNSDAHIEEIEKYLTGQMNAFDRGMFELRLQNDEQLRDQTESLLAAIEIAKQYRAHELKQYIEKNAPKVYKNTFWQTTIIYSAAASLILLTISYGLLVYYDSGKKNMAQDVKTRQSGGKSNPKLENTYKDHITTGHDSANSYGAIDGNGNTLSTDTLMEFKSLEDIPALDKDMVMQERKAEGENVPASANSADNFKIQTDELLLDSTYTTYFVVETPLEKKSAVKKKNIILPQTYRNNNQSAPQKADAEEDKTVEYKPSQTMNVEFWKSPVNYKGYRFNTKKLIIFGMKPADVMLIKVKGILYIKSQGLYYKIEENDRFNNFWPEATPPVNE